MIFFAANLVKLQLPLQLRCTILIYVLYCFLWYEGSSLICNFDMLCFLFIFFKWCSTLLYRICCKSKQFTLYKCASYYCGKSRREMIFIDCEYVYLGVKRRLFRKVQRSQREFGGRKVLSLIVFPSATFLDFVADYCPHSSLMSFT